MSARPRTTVAPPPSLSLGRWTTVATILLGMYTLGLVAFGVSMVAPGAVRRIGLGAYADPAAWWPILIQVVLGIAAFWAYYRPRRRDQRNFSVLVTGVLGASTIGLGTVAYSTCTSVDGESPFWTPLTLALSLIVGNAEACSASADPETAAPLPLALQLVRLFGLLLLVVAALGIVTSIFRAQSDRIHLRFTRAAIVLVGLTEEALPLLRRLSSERENDTTLAVLVEDAANPLSEAAREFGARVVACDPENIEALRSLLSSRGTFKVRAFYAASADVAFNLRWAAQLRTVANTTRPIRADMPPRLIVRIDDPWQAEYWRRTNAYRSGSGGSVRWMSDALSAYEVTAALLLDRICDPARKRRFDRLVIVGNSPLALAVSAELAQREREGEALRKPPYPSFAELLLVGPEAEVLRGQHRLRQERFGNVGDRGQISVVLDDPTPDNLRRVLQSSRYPVLILAEDPALGHAQLATYLAALNPTWTIFDWSQATHGVAEEPIMELLFPFGLTTEAPSSLPVDSWERAARIVHEQYREAMRRNGQLDPGKPSHAAWEALDPFLKESNIRQVTTTLYAAEALGRSWGPIEPGGADDGLVASAEVTERELDLMARAEHASWMKHHQDNGWRHGPRDAERRTHPSLVDWEQLSDEDKAKSRVGVASALNTLTSLGYRSTVLRSQAESAPRPEGEWVEVTRRGEIAAERADQDWTWVNESGHTMQARAGDWRVTDDQGRSWSVAPEIFAATYAPVSGNRWRRTGVARARPAVRGEVVVSLEGSQTAKAGDWVISGSKGERWITSDEHFRANYERSAPAS